MNNVIFDPQQKTQPTAPQAPQVSRPIAPTPQAMPTQPSQPPQPPQPPPPPIPQKNNLKKLLLFLIPILIVVLLIFGIIRVLLPLFSKVTTGSSTLIYWGLWEPKSVMEPVIQDFQKEYPHIKVTYELRDIKGYKEALLSRIANDTGPDVFRFHNSWTRSMRGVLAPLPASVITSQVLQEEYYPVVTSDVVVGGAIYGVPLHMDTLSLFVNTAIFQENGATVPQTWEDFIKTAVSITVKDQEGTIKTAGTALGTYDNVTHAPDIISLLFAQNRANLKNPGKTPEAVAEALRFYTNFALGRDALDVIWDSTKEQSLTEFSAENVAMYFGYSWDIFAIKAKNPKLEFEVYPVPYLVKPVTIASYWVEGVSVKSKRQKDAMLFMQFLARKETQQKLFTQQSKVRLFGELPARKDLGASLAENKLIYPFVKQADQAVSSYFVSDTLDSGFNEQLNGYLGNAVRSILENTSAESASETLIKGAEQVLTRYGAKQ